MKKLSFMFLLLCSGLVFGQMQAVSQKVQNLNMMNQQFSKYELFTKDEAVSKTSKFLTSATDVTVLKIDNNTLSKVVSEAPEYLTLSVPYLNEVLNVQMYKQEILTDSFYATDEFGNFVDYTPGQYYRGIVEGDYNSLVAISFFENDVMGVISTLEKGNVVLGKSTDGFDYVTYSDVNLLGENPFVCGVDDMEYNQELMEDINFDPYSAFNAPETTNCVRIYYELTQKIWNNRGRDWNTVLNWITGVHNNVETLYDNDNINISMSQVKVWTFADPYSGSYSDNLSKFQSAGNDFDGDIGHLISTPATTSVAYLDSLCGGNNHAYSAISMVYQEVPAYSWTISTIAHEMGHSMGSPHTHACAWNGNNTAIDGCGPAGGSNEGCNGPIPPEGGTIMSYCHLVSVGTNLALGFGPQPGQLIRNNVDAKACLSSDCGTTDYCGFTIQGITSVSLDSDTVQISINDSSADTWVYQVVPYGQPVDADGWTTTTSDTFTVSSAGLTPFEYYEVHIVNKCDNGSLGGAKKALVLFGDYCDGTLFTDTGGTSGNYGNNEYLVKTFYPSSSNGAVILNISNARIQPGSDYLYIHNGNSPDAPLFDGGTISVPNVSNLSFTSTASDGTITVVFISDGGGTFGGWSATLDCDSLGVADLNSMDEISIYPNPASDFVNISSSNTKIDSVVITDASGRVVMTNKMDALSGKVNIAHLPKGVYMVSLTADGKTVTKKIIKR